MCVTYIVHIHIGSIFIKMIFECLNLLWYFLLAIVFSMFCGVFSLQRFVFLFCFIFQKTAYTPGRRQSKTPKLSRNADQKSIETVFSIVICRHIGDKWQSKTLFPSIFDPRSSIADSVFDCRLPGVCLPHPDPYSVFRCHRNQPDNSHTWTHLKYQHIGHLWSKGWCHSLFEQQHNCPFCHRLSFQVDRGRSGIHWKRRSI